MDDSIRIHAVLDFIIFENKAAHYIVGSFSETKTYHMFTATGTMLNPEEDTEYQLTGHYVTHPKYGKQFQIETATKVLPKQVDTIIHFLSGEHFPTIGRKTAEQIYEVLGDDCLERIKEDPDVLFQIHKLTKKKREIIVQGIQDFQGFDDAYIELTKLGIHPSKITQLQDQYENVMDVLKTNAFQPMYDIHGFGYKTALKIADGLQVEAQDPQRLDAYLYELTRNISMQTGNTFILIPSIIQYLSNINPQDIMDSLLRLNDVESIHMDSSKVYPFGLYEDEKTIANLIRMHSFSVQAIDDDEIDQRIQAVEFANTIEYDEIQKSAIHAFFNHSFSILNGGPGTGKTTTVKGILMMCKELFPTSTIQLCAPTGRASKRLAELSEYDSKTIHSLLKWNKEDNTFAKNESDPLEIDFLIVDEFSMVDTHLFASLLKALPARCRILLIGDENQLESVGPGKVFKDLIESKFCPITHLEKVFRQSDGSGIITLAKEIRQHEPLTYEDGITFLEKNTPDILPTILEIAQKDDAQVLAPKYGGAAGIDEINIALQELMNPYSPNRSEIKVGTTIFRQRDKVMLLKNLPEEDVYNGDMGTIEYIEKNGHEYIVSVDFGNTIVDFTTDILYYLKHAYCISIHKSQGSEYDSCICVIDKGSSRMLNQRLLYTAISRAKKSLYIVGQKELFENYVQLKQKRIRQTSLQEAIQKAFD